MITHKPKFTITHVSTGLLKSGDKLVFDPNLDEPRVEWVQGTRSIPAIGRHVDGVQRQPWRIEVAFETEKGNLRLFLSLLPGDQELNCHVHGVAKLVGKNNKNSLQAWAASEI